MLGNPGSESGVPNGPPSTALVRRLAGRTGTLFLVLSHTTGQGDILHAPGLLWLEQNCDAPSCTATRPSRWSLPRHARSRALGPART